MESMAQQETLHPRHDTSYRFLLSSKKLFVELLRSFIKRDWIQDLNEEQVEEIPHTFILQDFKRQEADLVYRVKLNGQDVIFYLLLELQSSVDYRMPYRLLLYQVEIWRYLIQNDATLFANRKSFQLPTILPIVLYNGKRKWRAKRQFRQLLAGEELFESELLNFEYLFIDVVRYTEEELLQLSNIIGSILLLDQTDEVPQLLTRIDKLAHIVKQLPPEDKQKFFVWMENVLQRRLTQHEKDVQRLLETLDQTMEEGEEMLRFEKALYKLRKQSIQEGLQEGKLEGMQEGLQTGQRMEREVIAKRMLNLGMDISVVVSATGITEQEIELLDK
ncbi:Rpn family recombination-promoting nuclease/putative transposase [Paenibacillus yanchengensis]|uniref:Rpn family recombination-promoting nuclease/putative transposase n=1 Tax=Paenibacillus yanchengensis TaxID=2035833 RepID=A0ABW4YJ96_9BACL